VIQYPYHFRVRYKDIDRMGIMYYSRYFEYFEAARTDLMHALGLSYDDLAKEGIFMPVIRAEARYYRGPHFDDRLRIITSLPEKPRNRMEIRYRVEDVNQPGEILNEGMTLHAFVNGRGKAVRVPANLKLLVEEKWGSWLNDE